MPKKIDAPLWWNLHPADMTVEQLTQARDWFNQRSAALVDRVQRVQNAEAALNRALIERLAIPHDDPASSPPWPDLADDDLG